MIAKAIRSIATSILIAFLTAQPSFANPIFLRSGGGATSFEHDAAGNLTRILYPDAASESFAYDAHHRLIRHTDPRGFPATYEYDFAGRVARTIPPDGAARQMTNPQEVGLVDLSAGVGTPANPAPVRRPSEALASFTDGAGITRTALDSLGAPLTLTDPLGRVTVIERNANGLPTRITRPNGAVSTFSYDSRGNLLSTTEQAIGATTAFTYDPAFNQVTSITDPKGNLTRISYDAKGNPHTITDAQGNVTGFAYDSRGLLTAVTDPLGTATPAIPDDHQTRFSYDPATFNLAATTDPVGNTSTLAYDPAGNVAGSTDAEGRTTQFVYDALNRLTSVTDPGAGATGYGYDTAGNLSSVTDANGNATAFTYDALSRLVRAENALGQSKRFFYDGSGHLLRAVDAKGQGVEFSYDAADQLTQKVLKDATGALQDTVSYAYDAVGNLASVQDGDSKLAFTYDLLGRLTEAVTGDPSNPALAQPVTALTYTYDSNGNRLTTADPTGTTTYSYDALNRLTSLRGPGGAEAISYTYDGLSRRTGLALPDGTEAAYTYDAASQLLALVHRLQALPSTVLAQSDYTYDPVGNRTSLTDVPGVHSYSYDAINRLIAATHPVAAQLPNESYSYDSVGNRLSSHLSATHTYDAANRLLDDDAFTYTYDANGNQISKVEKLTGTATPYTYDIENQLVGVGLPGGGVVAYRYDGLGRRIEKSHVSGLVSQVSRYVYDNEDILLEFDGSNALKARWTHGPGIDEPLSMERDLDADGVFEAGERFFYHADGLGNIVALTGSAGAVVERYRYDSFGQPTILAPGPDGLMDTADDVVLPQSAFGNPYLFTGREFDPETGLIYMRARYYDPSTGRFLQQDPVFQQNLYPYADNNPVNLVDPSGETPLFVAIVVAGALVGGILVGSEEAEKGGSFGRGFLRGVVQGGSAAAVATFVAQIPGASALLVGGSSGAVSSFLGQLVNGPVDFRILLRDTAIAALTAGILSRLPVFQQVGRKVSNYFGPRPLRAFGPNAQRLVAGRALRGIVGFGFEQAFEKVRSFIEDCL